MKRLLIICCALALTSTTCKKNRTGDCPEDIMCTMDFRTIQVTITQNGNPVQLDKFRTVRLSDNKEFDLQTGKSAWEDSAAKALGSYPVLSDGELRQLSTKAAQFEFRGYRNGVLVIAEKYMIRHDCCHVERVEGRTNIAL